jgi:methylated-DNA-[protein]-cysteine S-methyltransferase
MKEQTAILPKLPIVGSLKLTSLDGKRLTSIEVTSSHEKPSSKPLDPFFKHCYVEIKNFLVGNTRIISIPVDSSRLTPFQQEVLKAMSKIPFGEKKTYKDLAQMMGNKAYQAIGSACGNNPFLLIYPCHRVVGSQGPGGFAHGLEMKKKLWELEKSY